MTNFDQAFHDLIAHEGGFSDRPLKDDPGGRTMWGITEKVAREWGYLGPMQELPQETARAIAKAKYWTPYQCDQLPYALAFQVFDTAYNGGYAARWLQEAVGARPDGVIGAKTIAAARDCDIGKAILHFNAKRLLYLTSLSNWPANARGWTIRVAKNLLKGAAP